MKTIQVVGAMLTTIGTSDKLYKLHSSGQSNPGETKSTEVTAPTVGPVVCWSPKFSTFSGSDSNVEKELTK